uniref:bcl-2-associated transcription factor 1-like isoform X3 n=1 Tax=Myxine glutinosa TaxID=7769 RepID=UPI00358FBA7C
MPGSHTKSATRSPSRSQSRSSSSSGQWSYSKKRRYSSHSRSRSYSHSRSRSPSHDRYGGGGGGGGSGGYYYHHYHGGRGNADGGSGGYLNRGMRRPYYRGRPRGNFRYFRPGSRGYFRNRGSRGYGPPQPSDGPGRGYFHNHGNSGGYYPHNHPHHHPRGGGGSYNDGYRPRSPRYTRSHSHSPRHRSYSPRSPRRRSYTRSRSRSTTSTSSRTSRSPRPGPQSGVQPSGASHHHGRRSNTPRGGKTPSPAGGQVSTGSNSRVRASPSPRTAVAGTSGDAVSPTNATTSPNKDGDGEKATKEEGTPATAYKRPSPSLQSTKAGWKSLTAYDASPPRKTPTPPPLGNESRPTTQSTTAVTPSLLPTIRRPSALSGQMNKKNINQHLGQSSRPILPQKITLKRTALQPSSALETTSKQAPKPTVVSSASSFVPFSSDIAASSSTTQHGIATIGVPPKGDLERDREESSSTAQVPMEKGERHPEPPSSARILRRRRRDDSYDDGDGGDRDRGSEQPGPARVLASRREGKLYSFQRIHSDDIDSGGFGEEITKVRRETEPAVEKMNRKRDGKISVNEGGDLERGGEGCGRIRDKSSSSPSPPPVVARKHRHSETLTPPLQMSISSVPRDSKGVQDIRMDSSCLFSRSSKFTFEPRQLSHDLVSTSGHSEHSFKSIFDHIPKAPAARPQSPTQNFVSHIVSLVHYVREHRFPPSLLTLNERFGKLPKKAQRSPEIHRRIDVNPEFLKQKGRTDCAERFTEGTKDDEHFVSSDIGRERRRGTGIEGGGKGDYPEGSLLSSRWSHEASSPNSDDYGNSDRSRNVGTKVHRSWSKNRMMVAQQQGIDTRYQGLNREGWGSEGRVERQQVSPQVTRRKDETWDPEYTPRNKKYFLHDDRADEWITMGSRERPRSGAGTPGGFPFGKANTRSSASPHWSHDKFNTDGEGGVTGDNEKGAQQTARVKDDKEGNGGKK